jgi:hypothetical protein
MKTRKWRVMLTLEDSLNSLTPEQIQEFVKETLEDMGDIKVQRCEAVEVTQ